MTKVESPTYARGVTSLRWPSLILLALAFLAPSWAEAWSLDSLEALGPRYEGSAALAASLDLIEAGLREAGISPRRFSTEGSPGSHSFSSNLEALIPGARPDRLYIVVPVDNYQGEGGERGRGGIVLALEAARSLSAQAEILPISLSFVFLGAEHRWRRGEDRSGGLGALALIKQGEDVPSRAFLYLEADSTGSGYSLVNTSKALLSPYWIYDRVRLSLEAASIPYSVDANLMQVHRLGLGDQKGSLSPFLEASLPAVELLGVQAGAARATALEMAQDSEAFSRFLRSLATANASGFSDSWDRDYLSFQILGKSFVMRETPYIGLLVGLASFLILVLLILSVTHRRAAKAVLARWPIILGQIGVIYVLAVTLFLAGRLVSSLEAGIFGSKDFWISSPGLFLILRLVSAFFFFLAIVLILVNLRVLSGNPRFYEMAAFAVLFADFFVYSAILPPFIFYFAWAMLFVGLSLALRKSHWTIVCYGLMYLPFMLLANTIIHSPEMAFHRSFIFPGVQEGLLAAAASLPFFVFTASPLLFFVKPTRRARRIASGVFLLLALAIESGGVLARLKAAGEGERSPSLAETLDQDRGSFTAVLSDSRRLGDLELERGGQTLHFSSRKDSAAVESKDGGTYVSLRKRSSTFLGRSLIELEFDFRVAPYYVEISLDSPKDMHFYDCSLPYEVALDGLSARIFVGAGPPVPLRVQVTVPTGFEAILHLEASYLSTLVPWALPSGLSLGRVDEKLKASWPLLAGP